jgi:diketogulonate reductase-like aldo/keto reductase
MQALFDSGVVKDRRDVFLSGTLEQADFYRVSDSLERTLTNLGTDYLDLYLMNWPDVGCGSDNVEGRNRIWRCAALCCAARPVPHKGTGLLLRMSDLEQYASRAAAT